MVSAQVFIAFIKAPGNRKAGDDASQEILGLMGTQHRHAGAIQIDFPERVIEFQKAVLPMFPVPDVVLAQFAGGERERVGTGFLSSLGQDAKEPRARVIFRSRRRPGRSRR